MEEVPRDPTNDLGLTPEDAADLEAASHRVEAELSGRTPLGGFFPDDIRQMSKVLENVDRHEQVMHDLPDGSRIRTLYEEVMKEHRESLESLMSDSHLDMAVGVANRYLAEFKLRIFGQFHGNVTTRIEHGFDPYDAVTDEVQRAHEKLAAAGTRSPARETFTFFIEELGSGYRELYKG